MPRIHRLELSGQTFGQWSVIEISHRNKTGEVFWRCICSCGTERAVVARSLRMGTSISCGCTAKNWCTKHGKEGSSIYNIWAGMVQRCHNPKSGHYHRYGARGISVCQEWRDSFENFYRDMGDRPDGLTLDRINNDGNYEPGNCRWATIIEQINNRRVTRFLTLGEDRRPLMEWARFFGVTQKYLACRLDRGWSDERILTELYAKNGKENKAA